MKGQSFRALCAGGEETEFREGLIVENGTTNHLLSLIISLNYKRSKLKVKASALRAGGGKLNSDKE